MLRKTSASRYFRSIDGMTRIILHFGFTERPDVPEAIALAIRQGKLSTDLKLYEFSYYIGRETVIPRTSRTRFATLARGFVRLHPAQFRALGHVFRHSAAACRRDGRRDRDLTLPVRATARWPCRPRGRGRCAALRRRDGVAAPANAHAFCAPPGSAGRRAKASRRRKRSCANSATPFGRIAVRRAAIASSSSPGCACISSIAIAAVEREMPI